MYYVEPDINDSSSTANDTFTLQHYISNAEDYFISYNELCFLPDIHQLNTTLVLKDVDSFTLSGINTSIIRCATHTSISIVIINVTNFVMKSIQLIGCGKCHCEYIKFRYQKLSPFSDPVPFIKTTGHSASVFIHRSKSVEISNITIAVIAGFAGLLAIDVKNDSSFKNIKVQVNCSACLTGCDHFLSINGMVFYYKYSKLKYKPYVRVNVSNFQYTSIGLCLRSSHYAMTLLFRQCFTVFFNIYNTTLSGFTNSSALYYYDKMCVSTVNNKLFIKDFNIRNNIGNPHLRMVYINLADVAIGSKEHIFQNKDRQHSSIVFRNCYFINNTNFEAMIYIVPTISKKITGYIEIQQGKFYNNTDTHFIKVRN